MMQLSVFREITMRLCLVLQLFHCYSFIAASLPTDQFSGELRRLVNDILGVSKYQNYQVSQISNIRLYSINSINVAFPVTIVGPRIIMDHVYF